MDPKETSNQDYTTLPEHHLNLRDLLKLSVRAFKVRPMRTFLTILGMSVGIGTVFFLISLGYGMQHILLGKLAPTEDSLLSLEVYYPGDGGLSVNNETVQSALAIPGVVEVSPVAEVPGEVASGALPGSVVVKTVRHNYFRLSGFESDMGQSSCGEGEPGVIVSNTALRLMNLPEDSSSLDKNITIKAALQSSAVEGDAERTESTKPLPIVGIVNDENQQPYIYVRSDELTKEPQSFSRFFVKTKDDKALEQVRQTLLEKGFLISAKADTVMQARKITTAITIVLAVFGIAALIVSAIGMFNTMLISFMERIFEVGIMKSIGATRRDILNLFLIESLVMGLLGGIGGILMGFLIGQIFNFGLNMLARYLGGKPVVLFSYPLQFVVLIIALSGIVGLLSGFWPARRAATLSAREAFLRK